MTPAKGYTEMKDSGILGCGSIPSHWETIPLKYVALLDGKVDVSNIASEDMVSFAPMECVRNDKRIPRTALKSKDNGTYSSFCNGDIAIAKVTPCFENGNICMMESLENGYAFGSSELFSVRPQKIVGRYLFYSLQTPYFLDGGAATMTGVGGLKRVSSYYMKNVKIVLPPLSEQSAIASYLDTQCAKIDEIIAQAKASIEDYKQWKASIIYEAVTKGLDPNVEMEDSGIDIIGEMPRHWEKCRLKYLCDIMTGNQDTQNADENGEYPFYVRSPIVQRAKDYTYEGEGILMAGDGAGAGRVFHHAVGKYAIHQRVYCFHNFRNISVEYFLYFISELFKRVMDKGSAQSTVPSVRLPMIQDFVFCIPPVEEQTKIVNFLTQKCSKIYELISEKQSLIDDLESYKKSLIYEVVTGKRRVY